MTRTCVRPGATRATSSERVSSPQFGFGAMPSDLRCVPCVHDHSITAYCEEHSIDAEACVREMRETVCRETKLTVSAGIAPNKVRSRGPLLPSSTLSAAHLRLIRVARISDARKGDSIHTQYAGAPPDVGPDLFRQGSYPPLPFPLPPLP